MKQAYGSEPVLFSSSPITPPQKQEPASKKRWSLKALTIGLLLVVGLVSGGWFLLYKQSSAGLPASAAAAVSFPLYQPGWLPKGYSVDQQSFSVTSQVATFTVRNSNSDVLIITEQPRPSIEKINSFYDGQLTNKKTFDVNIGKAATGTFEGAVLAGITTDKTWLLIREFGGLEQAQLERIIRSFRPVK